MGVYQIGKKWYADLYMNGRRKRKAIGSRKEAENALTAIKADVLRGEFKFKRENKVHFEAFTKDYLEHCRTNKKRSVSRDENSIKFLEANFSGLLVERRELTTSGSTICGILLPHIWSLAGSTLLPLKRSWGMLLSR